MKHIRERPDGKVLPIAMRKPRNCRRGWFYINPVSIDVVVGQCGSIVTLDRRQLLGALKVMDRFAEVGK